MAVRTYSRPSSSGTAAGVAGRPQRGDLATERTTAIILEILKAQQLRDGLPAWLPPDTVVAHKTGGLPGVANDA